jgi:hypothetical protein
MASRLLASPLIVATSALFAALPAHAQATYDLALTGQVEHTVDCWETVPLCSGPPSVTYPWTGTLTVVVDSSADGTYTDAAFESLTLSSNIAGFSIDPGDWDAGFTVTIGGHQVTSIAADFPLMTLHDSQASIEFDGLESRFNGSGETHYGPTNALGSLSPVAEPRGDLSILIGLAALATVAKTRRRPDQTCTNGQRGFTSNA